MLTLFKSIELSRLDYGSQLWSPFLIKHIIRLEKIERSFTKHISGMNDMPFANIADNEMFERNINQNGYCDINNLHSSNNDVDLDINNLILNYMQNQCKGYDTSSKLRKNICIQNNIAMLYTNITYKK